MSSPSPTTLSMKRPAPGDTTHAKRRALQPVSNSQLATPPSTPEKNSVIDISSKIKSPGRKLNLCQDSVYANAKAAFQRCAKISNQKSLVGREKEAAVFETFLKNSIANRTCNSMYISGPPGTGKTAQTSLTLDNLCKGSEKDLQLIYGIKTRVLKVNCMTFSKPEHIFHELYSALMCDASGRKKTFDNFYELLTTQSETECMVVVLDEMDYLITKDQQVLFQLFHCASSSKSSILKTKLVVIGISNALDLTDKFLPRLRSNGFDPEALQFLPYSADQIKQVVISKLRALNEDNKENVPSGIPLMHPGAIQMCCKKCATVTGDLRKAFDICYKSIELVEQQAKQRDDFRTLTLDSAPKVLISHVAKVCTTAFGDSSHQKLSNLNLLQKAVLCCLFSSERNTAKHTPLTINELYDYYCKNTLRVIENLLGKIKKGEFLEIIGALESASAITLSTSPTIFGSVDGSNKQIKPNVSYADMLKCSEEVGVLKAILLESS